MKRSPLTRKSELRRKATIAKRNEERIARKRKAYRAYLASSPWKKLRAERILLDGGRCRQCGTTEQLTVDHLTYIRFGGEELMQDLQTLCRPCHRSVEAARGRAKRWAA